MKKLNQRTFTVILMVLSINFSIGQQKANSDKLEKTKIMKTYVIEREIPEAGKLNAVQLKGISQTSCNVLKKMGAANIAWQHSYVTEDKIYCVYKALNKELLIEHAKLGGFPATKISELSTIINPETAN